jgi:hypothetical protein
MEKYTAGETRTREAWAITERATVGGERDREKEQEEKTFESVESERATVGGERDREKEQEENSFESVESERATVGGESDNERNAFGSDKAKEEQLEMKQRESERATVGGETDKEKVKEQQSEEKLTTRGMHLKAIKRKNKSRR